MELAPLGILDLLLGIIESLSVDFSLNFRKSHELHWNNEFLEATNNNITDT